MNLPETICWVDKKNFDPNEDVRGGVTHDPQGRKIELNLGF